MPDRLQSILSIHAKERLAERFKISEDKLLAHLNYGKLGVRLGYSSSQREIYHIMLWSEEDRCPVVLIRNISNGVILTVLTLEMYQRDYPDRVSDIKIQKSVNQVKNRQQKLRKQLNLPSISSKVIVKGLFCINGALKVKSLGDWKGTVAVGDISSLGSSQAFWQWVIERVNKKGLSLSDLVRITGGYKRGDRIEIKYDANLN